MPVAVVGVREVRMRVLQRRVNMRVRVRRPRSNVAFVRMCVMRVASVVLVFVAVRDWMVVMRVLMPLGQVQPYADAHQQAGTHQPQRDRLVQQRE